MVDKKIITILMTCIAVIIIGISSVAYVTEESAMPETITVTKSVFELQDEEYYAVIEGQHNSLAAYDNITFVIRDDAENVVFVYQETTRMQGIFSVRLHWTNFDIRKNYTVSIADEYGNMVGFDIDKRFYEDKYVEVVEKISRVNELIENCSEVGMVDCEYEKLAVGIAEYLLSDINENYLIGDEELYSYQLESLNRILDESIDALHGYLSGERIQRKTVEYTVGDVLAENGILYNQTDTGKREVYLTGYHCFEKDKVDFEGLKKLGINHITLEVPLGQSYESQGTVFIVPYGFRGPWEMDETQYLICAEDKIVADGKGSAKLVSKGPSVGIATDVKLKANTTYEFGADILADRTGYIGMDFRKVAFSDSEQWQTVTSTFTADADCQISYVVQVDGQTDGIYVDNMYVREVGSNVNLLANGDVEQGNIIRSQNGDFCYTVETSWIEKLREWIKEAEKNNISICVALTPHYMPGHIGTVSNGVSDTGYNHDGFMIYNPTDKVYNELIKAMYDVAVEKLSDCKALNQFMLANEPSFTMSESPYYLPVWQNFLKDRYGSIEELNAVYGTEYSDFHHIDMPKEVSLSPMYKDYRELNDSLLTEAFSWQTEYLKEKAPHIETVVKTLQSNNYIRDQYKNGNDYENWSEFFEINGCDTMAYYNEEKNSIMIRGMWYDYIRSVKDAPIMDLEMHFLRDGYGMDYNEVIPSWAEAVLWHGAMHGVYSVTTWLWKNELWTDSKRNTILSNRPECMFVIGEMNYDLNRLANEIGVLQAKKAKVAMYYSRENRDDMENYILNMEETYEAVVKYGEKVDFITDSQPEKLNCGQYNLLVLTDIKIVSADVLEEIEKFISGGGKVMLVHSSSVASGSLLALGTDGSRNDTQRVNNIKNASTVVWKPLLAYFLKTAISEATGKNVRLVDKNGKDIDDCEWSYEAYGTEYLINITNHNPESSVSAYIEIDGKKVSDFTDLRTLEKYEDCINLESYKPMLLKTNLIGAVLDVEVEENRITATASVTPSAELDKAMLVLSVYKDNVLLDIDIKNIDASESECVALIDKDTAGNGLYRISRFLFDEKLQPIINKEDYEFMIK